MITQNDILRRLRYAFDFTDDQVIEIFTLGEYNVDRALVCDFLKRDDDEEYKDMNDKELAHFLNGFIIKHRGRKEGVEMVAENRLDNNQIFRKLKIALSLKDTDVVEIMNLAEYRISKHEVNAFLRAPKQRQYREMLDQALRNFIKGLQIKYRK